METNVLLSHLVRIAIISFIICGLGAASTASAQETYAARSQAMLRWADAEAADVFRGLPPGTEFPPPSATGIANALNLFSTSPLTGSGMQQPGGSVGGSPPSSGGASAQSPPPINIQLPPPPPERYAPSARGQPPIQIPDPSTIPSPPLSQAPPQQQRPPIQLPNPSAGASALPPIQLPAIPLPPHPPEERAPWNRRR